MVSVQLNVMSYNMSQLSERPLVSVCVSMLVLLVLTVFLAACSVLPGRMECPEGEAVTLMSGGDSHVRP